MPRPWLNASPPTARDIVIFWREAGPGRWFEKDERSDATCHHGFLDQHMAVTTRQHDDWIATENTAEETGFLATGGFSG